MIYIIMVVEATTTSETFIYKKVLYSGDFCYHNIMVIMTVFKVYYYMDYIVYEFILYWLIWIVI
jgi:hypothetical protein